jgi:aspartate/methionine/tyrosine aminotransferase
MKIETFEMERMQCLFENKVELNLSESGVLPLSITELLDGADDIERFVTRKLSYNESDGSQVFRERIAQFYPDDCQPENITVTNGGSEANYVTLWTLLESDGRLGLYDPQLYARLGPGACIRRRR